jgi:hypothetical protein
MSPASRFSPPARDMREERSARWRGMTICTSATFPMPQPSQPEPHVHRESRREQAPVKSPPCYLQMYTLPARARGQASAGSRGGKTMLYVRGPALPADASPPASR